MRLLHCLAVVAAVGSVSSTALAKESGFEFGGSLGYGFPWGRIFDPPPGADTDGNLAVRNWVSGQIPLQVDIGYRINPQVFVGGYLGYGIGFVGDECDDLNADCNAGDLRFGGELIYHFTPITEDNAGWIGGGIGFESLRVEQKYDFGDSMEQTLTGFEFLNFQVGYDIAISDKFRLGPYAMLTVAQYAEASYEADYGDVKVRQSDDIDDKAMHGWVMFGVMGTFGPF